MSAVPSTEDRVRQTAREIFAAMAGEKPGRLSKERLQGEMMEWAMADERLKVEMLRFVDVFPTLRSRPEIARHLREYFAREGVAAPAALRWGISLTGRRSPVAPLASAVIRSQMKGFAQRFIVGRDARGAVPALRALRGDGVGFTLDVLGEATVSDAEGRAYQQVYLDLLDGLATEAASWPAISVIDQAAWGPLPRVNLSLKITSLYSQIDPIDFQGSVAAVKDLLRPIFRKGIDDRRRPDPGPGAVPLPRPHARGVHVAPRRGGVPRLPRRRTGAAGVPPRRRPGPRAPPGLGARPRPALQPPPGQGRLLGLRDRHRRPGGLAGAGVHPASPTPTPCTRS